MDEASLPPDFAATLWSGDVWSLCWNLHLRPGQEVLEARCQRALRECKHTLACIGRYEYSHGLGCVVTADAGNQPAQAA